MRLNLLTAGMAAIVLGLAPTAASAQSLLGLWERDNGLSRVRFVRCGASFCADVVWLKAPKLDEYNPDPALRGDSVMGRRIFFDLAPGVGNEWTGKAYNTDDGQTYSGRVHIEGEQMFTTGCVIAGLVCTTVRWRRVR